MRGLWTALCAICAGCGSESPSGPAPLVPDVVVVSGCAAPAAGAVQARVACASDRMAGPLGSARAGDLVLENARVKVVIRGPGEGFYLHGTSGGGIIDAGRQGGVDVVKELQPIVELSVGLYDELVIVESGDDGPAEIAMRGHAALVPLLAAVIGDDPLDVLVEHRYRLEADSDVLVMQTLVWPGDGGEDPGAITVGDAFFLGGRTRALLPGRGWAAAGVSAAEMIAVDGGDVGLALAYDGGTTQLLDVEGIRFARGPVIQVGDGVGMTRRLVIAESMVDAIRQASAEATYELTVTTAADEVVAANQAGDAYTVGLVRDGSTKLWLPAGSWTITGLSGLAGPSDAPVVTLPADEGVNLVLTDAPEGSIAHDVIDLPVRLTLWDAAGSQSVHFLAPDTPVRVAPGTWRAAISRGLEYDAVILDGEIAVGELGLVPGPLPRVVDTDGWIAIDTHLHSEMSTDSTIPLADRLRAVAAEGIELAISTDHDFLTEYGPIVQDLGLEPYLATAVGVEASSFIWGHLNAWPLVIDEDVPAHGAPAWYQRSPAEVMGDLRAADEPVIQVNHPRNTTMGLFSLIDFNRATMMAMKDPMELGLPAGAQLLDLGFDAVEVCNEGGESFEAGFQDWLALVAAGHGAAATGSSDSHGATSYAGKCRTYVHVGAGEDDPTTVDVRAVNDALRARHVTVAGGSFVTAGIAGSLPGDLVDAAGLGEVAIRVRVQAPAWSPLLELRIYEKTELVRTIPLDPSDLAVVRFDEDVLMPLDGTDTAFVIRVEPAGASVILGGTNPSFTNPILVDADGDGVFTP